MLGRGFVAGVIVQKRPSRARLGVMGEIGQIHTLSVGYGVSFQHGRLDKTAFNQGVQRGFDRGFVAFAAAAAPFDAAAGALDAGIGGDHHATFIAFFMGDIGDARFQHGGDFRPPPRRKAQDANGDYIYGGGNSTTPPVSVTSLSQLTALGSSAAGAFTNGNDLKSVQVADGQTVTYGMTASSIGQGLMQEIQNIANFDAGGTGNFSGSTNLSQAQNNFLTGEISAVNTVSTNLNNVTAQNGDAYNALQSAASQQSDMSTLYSGFISNIQDTNMANAATQLQLNQTALQAALQVTSTLNQLTLLNYMPAATTTG